jgi:glycosyltransferase involved in cell wall biosynthesis
VIANDIPANAEVVTNGVNGILLNVTDREKFKNTLTEMCHSVKQFSALGTAARKTVIENYSMPQTATFYTELFNKLMTTETNSMTEL